MKIIHLVLGNAGVQIKNGMAKAAHKLASVQTKQGYNVTIWQISKSLQNEYFSRNYPTRVFLRETIPFNLDPEIYGAVSNLSKQDIVHFHGSFVLEFFQISTLLSDQNIPYIISSNDELSIGAMEIQKWWKIPYFYLFERRILNLARGVHVPGKSIKYKVEQLGCKSPIVVIPNGQDIIKWSRSEPVDEMPFTVIFCGLIDIYKKGLDISLHGFKLFLESGGEGQFEIIGDGKDMSKLKALVEHLGLQSNVNIYRSVNQSEKYKLFKRSDLILRSSRSDGCPITILEACAMGIPPAVSKATNTSGYIRKYNCGFVLRNNDSLSVSDTLHEAQRLWKRGKLHRMGLEARNMIETAFSWQEISNRLFSLYLNQYKSQPEKALRIPVNGGF